MGENAPSTTSAVVMTGPGEFEVREFELPDLGPGDVLLRVERNGVCGTDVHVSDGGLDVGFPILPGHEFAGHVQATGEDVETDARGRPLAVGDPATAMPFWQTGADWYSEHMPHREQLFTDIAGVGFEPAETGSVGGMSEYVLLPDGANVFALPDALEVGHGALAEPTSIAVHAYERLAEAGLPLLREGVGLGSSLAVQGVGPIGLLTVAVADYAGTDRIVAVDALAERLELAREFGATDTVDVTRYDDEDELVRAVEACTDSGLGPDAVVEATGVPEAVRQAIEIPHDGGYFLEVGHFASAGEVAIDPARIVQKELTILGSKGAPSSQFGTAVGILGDVADDVPLGELFDYPVEMSADAVEDAYETQADDGALRASVHPHGRADAVR